MVNQSKLLNHGAPEGQLSCAGGAGLACASGAFDLGGESVGLFILTSDGPIHFVDSKAKTKPPLETTVTCVECGLQYDQNARWEPTDS